ncbi:hypothetical protein AB205_0017830 [Aquarana catesbeiana]|uniref:Uncharacterized protein n=1 Tax=Aquarana catesbeiana TaxID=8400 RepID=A0A2G9RSL8_AQUCT|nr:hypothetical protein AB205_0017830 [Aquarana catesbeiana]
MYIMSAPIKAAGMQGHYTKPCNQCNLGKLGREFQRMGEAPVGWGQWEEFEREREGKQEDLGGAKWMFDWMGSNKKRRDYKANC